MATIEIDLKKIGQAMPEELARTAGAAVKIVLPEFTLPEYLEDYLDVEEAYAALRDPRNQERIPWEALRARLGL